MTAPHAVLLVPTEAGAALLAVGDLGAKPPVVWFHPAEGGKVRWSEWSVGRNCTRAALPLWWDGALVPEGWDRAERVWAAARARRCRTSDLDMCASQALLLAEGLEADGLCRVVLLDLADGRLVERSGEMAKDARAQR